MVLLKENQKEMDAVIFDLGNVLLDYSPRRFLGEIGISPEIHDRLAAVLFDDLDTWSNLDRGTLNNAGIIKIAVAKEPMLRKEITKFISKWPDHFNAIPENVASMYRIKETGTKVYVLSNFSEEVFTRERKRNAFLADFDGLIISYEHQIIKPQPEIYNLLIDKFQLSPAKSVFIDDLEANVSGAKNAGLNTIHLPACSPIEPFFIFPN